MWTDLAVWVVGLGLGIPSLGLLLYFVLQIRKGGGVPISLGKAGGPERWAQLEHEDNEAQKRLWLEINQGNTDWRIVRVHYPSLEGCGCHRLIDFRNEPGEAQETREEFETQMKQLFPSWRRPGVPGQCPICQAMPDENCDPLFPCLTQ